MAIEIIDPDSPIPEPCDKRALYFGQVTRDLFRNELAILAKQGKRQLFFDSENGRARTVGLTSIHQFNSLSAAGAELSNSHALHGLSKDVGSLNVGHWYEMAIDPSSNMILWAKRTEPKAVQGSRTLQSYKIDPATLPSLSPSQAEDFFLSVQRQPHIPFEFPANGCWSRAHEMCRLIECFFDKDPKAVAAKVWNFSARQLIVNTGNNPNCQVTWWHHVAPVFKVGRSLMVIDPSLFKQPVTVEEWVREQGDPRAGQEFTSRHAYRVRRRPRSFFGETAGESETELHYYRSQLIAQIYCRGPIPYDCRK